MGTTTKKDLIERIASETGQRRASVKKTVQCFLDNVIAELSDGNRLEFRDFGVFEIRERAPRIAQNPKTLERVPVPAKKTVKFKIGRLMREAIEGEDAERRPKPTAKAASTSAATATRTTRKKTTTTRTATKSATRTAGGAAKTARSARASK